MPSSLADAHGRVYRFRDIRRSLKSRRKMRVPLMQIAARRSTAYPPDATQAQPATPQGPYPLRRPRHVIYTRTRYGPLPRSAPLQGATGPALGFCEALPHHLSAKVPPEARVPANSSPGVPLRAARAAYVWRRGWASPGHTRPWLAPASPEPRSRHPPARSIPSRGTRVQYAPRWGISGGLSRRPALTRRASSFGMGRVLDHCN